MIKIKTIIWVCPGGYQCIHAQLNPRTETQEIEKAFGTEGEKLNLISARSAADIPDTSRPQKSSGRDTRKAPRQVSQSFFFFSPFIFDIIKVLHSPGGLELAIK